jgi:hypothetical protein
MSTNNCNHSDDLYRKCLDELSEIVAKYDFCNIVLAGDLNASFIRPKPTVIDKLFMEDIVEMGFVLPDKYPRDSTFHHFNGYSVSQIDYILPFRHCDFITDIKIHHRESLNTSTHDPVSGRFIIKPYINACQNEEHTINPQLNWKNCDVQNYQKLVTEQITDMDLLGIIDCEEQIYKMIEILFCLIVQISVRKSQKVGPRGQNHGLQK